MLRYVTGLCFLITVTGSIVSSAQTMQAGGTGASDNSWVRVDLTATAAEENSGLHILAKNVDDELARAEHVGKTREGIGAAGAQASAPAIKAETGYDPLQYRSEQIIILFDKPVAETDIDVAYFFRDEGEWGGVRYNEQGGWRAYHKNILIEEGRFLPEEEGGEHQIVIRAKAPFDRLEMFATPYVTESGEEIEPGAITTDSSDYLIKQISYRPAEEHQVAHAH